MTESIELFELRDFRPFSEVKSGTRLGDRCLRNRGWEYPSGGSLRETNISSEARVICCKRASSLESRGDARCVLLTTCGRERKI